MTKQEQTRLFWVVSSPDTNEEIFNDLAEAQAYAKEVFGTTAPYSITVQEVRHYYQEPSGAWNYDDHADTFTSVPLEIRQTDTRKEAQ